MMLGAGSSLSYPFFCFIAISVLPLYCSVIQLFFGSCVFYISIFCFFIPFHFIFQSTISFFVLLYYFVFILSYHFLFYHNIFCFIIPLLYFTTSYSVLPYCFSTLPYHLLIYHNILYSTIPYSVLPYHCLFYKIVSIGHLITPFNLFFYTICPFYHNIVLFHQTIFLFHHTFSSMVKQVRPSVGKSDIEYSDINCNPCEQHNPS